MAYLDDHHHTGRLEVTNKLAYLAEEPTRRFVLEMESVVPIESLHVLVVDLSRSPNPS